MAHFKQNRWKFGFRRYLVAGSLCPQTHKGRRMSVSCHLLIGRTAGFQSCLGMKEKNTQHTYYSHKNLWFSQDVLILCIWGNKCPLYCLRAGKVLLSGWREKTSVGMESTLPILSYEVSHSRWVGSEGMSWAQRGADPADTSCSMIVSPLSPTYPASFLSHHQPCCWHGSNIHMNLSSDKDGVESRASLNDISRWADSCASDPSDPNWGEGLWKW